MAGSGPRPQRTGIDWRWALPRIALVFLVSRLLVLSVAVAVESTQAPPNWLPASRPASAHPMVVH